MGSKFLQLIYTWYAVEFNFSQWQKDDAIQLHTQLHKFLSLNLGAIQNSLSHALVLIDSIKNSP